MGLIESAKDAAKLVQQIGSIEAYEKMVSFQQDAMALLDENRNLKDEIQSLKQEIEDQKRLMDVTARRGNSFQPRAPLDRSSLG